MSGVCIRSYDGSDEAAVLRVWETGLPCDAIDDRTFRRKVLLDPNFDPAWLAIADVEGDVAGFCLTLRRRVPFPKLGLEPSRAWITAMAVAPELRGGGVGGRLLDCVVSLCQAESRTELLLAPYVPNYFVPGVDEQAYASGLAWLLRRGFEVVSRAVAADANLVGFRYEEWAERERALASRGIRVRFLTPADIPALLGFLEATMPGDWLRHARDVLADIVRGHGSFQQFVIAEDAGVILGYCQAEGDHFGPFGVREDRQGEGIGTVLLARCLHGMKRRGSHDAWVVWTSDDSLERVYGRFGFHGTRRFSVLRLRIN